MSMTREELDSLERQEREENLRRAANASSKNSATLEKIYAEVQEIKDIVLELKAMQTGVTACGKRKEK